MVLARYTKISAILTATGVLLVFTLLLESRRLIVTGLHNMGGDPVPVAEDLKRSPFDMDIYCLAIGQSVNKRSVHEIASSPDQFWYLRRSEDLRVVTEHLLSMSETSE